MDVVWREARDLPLQFVGPVTAVQRQLSVKPDLADHLDRKNTSTVSGTASKPPSPAANNVLIWVCLGLLAFIAREGFREMKRWDAAPVLTGKFVSMEKVPRKKYLDLGPEALRKYMPDDPRLTREMYHIDYLDPGFRRRSVGLEAAEFYVPPRTPGEDVQIAYVAGGSAAGQRAGPRPKCGVHQIHSLGDRRRRLLPGRQFRARISAPAAARRRQGHHPEERRADADRPELR